MNKKQLLFILLLFLITADGIHAQILTIGADSASKPKQFKKGWKPFPFPIVGYNTDIGFQYGLALDLPYYGDGSLFPKYFHSFYLEASFTTKGGSIFQFFYDSERLIKGLRVTADVSYLTEKALDFYGFNGYKAVYNKAWTDDKDTAGYITRIFYRHERKLLKVSIAFQGKFITDQLRWHAGMNVYNFNVGPVDVARLNKGQKDDKKLPDTAGLYDNYVSWGILSSSESNGGMNNFIKAGFIYDTRDNEANPMKGIWSEINFLLAPKFLGDGDYGFIKLALIHRHYLTLVKNRLSFTYRVGYQGTLAGEVPFYFQPVMINSWEKTTTIDGLGGSRTIRGIMRNRVVGDGEIYANAEFRWKILEFTFLRQPCYFGANLYSDAGMVVDEIPMDQSGIPSTVDASTYFSHAAEYPHYTIGAGLKLAYNENTVLSADVGFAPDKRDGRVGIYIGFGFLF